MATRIEDFAALLREFKERSGRSYGQLASRLHVSTSTLHRYCNGAAVPTDYAPVERFARLCGASPDELIALHRRWLLADAARREPDRASEPVAAAPVVREPAAGEPPAGEPAVGARKAGTREAGTREAGTREAGTRETAEDQARENLPEIPPATELPDGTASARWLRSRRTALVLGAVAAVAAVAALPLTLHGTGGTQDVGASSPVPGRSATGVAGATSADPLGSAAASASVSASPTATDSTASPSASATAAPGGPPPFQVDVLADNWDTQCGQWFLMDRQPGRVPPPPSLEQSQAWASALGGIPAGHLRLQLTAQGVSSQSVVLHAAYIHVVSRKPAPRGIAYTPTSGCGGGLDPASFAVNLDETAPVTTPVPGTVGSGETSQLLTFPFQVSATDPQVIDLDASTVRQDVSWYLELVWSSGGREDRYVVNDHGRPFRTVGIKDDPAYFYNGSAWAPTQPDQ